MMSDLITQDTNENFYEFTLIKTRFEKWNTQFNETYRNAYISLSLPKLFAPLVRTEITDWNPLEKSSSSNYLETSKWFKSLLIYNQNELIKSLNKPDTEMIGDDFLLIPHIIEKTVLLKLIFMAESYYDPISTSQTIKFTEIVRKLINDYSTVNYKSTNTKKLIEAISARIKKSLDNDVYIPLYSKGVIEKRKSNSSQFYYRQFWSAVKVRFKLGVLLK